MAKIDKTLDENAQAIPPVAPPVPPTSNAVTEQPAPAADPQPMPVEAKEAQHKATTFVKDAVLSPGRSFKPAFDGVVGELEAALHKAEMAGDTAVAADLHSVLVKLGEIRNHIAGIEQHSAAHIKPLFIKVLGIFKK